MIVEFAGSIHSIKVDDEGSARLVLDIPSSDLGQALCLPQLVRQELRISIEVVMQSENAMEGE